MKIFLLFFWVISVWLAGSINIKKHPEDETQSTPVCLQKSRITQIINLFNYFSHVKRLRERERLKWHLFREADSKHKLLYTPTRFLWWRLHYIKKRFYMRTKVNQVHSVWTVHNQHLYRSDQLLCRYFLTTELVRK